ncbi:tyrosine-type recombinase/integrase [Selenomonas ruminantium]|uniref:tyrosine-type recombinase/integrase n=1 Tax=Selenomonas ruminantium TaxID=971 RepID=UPI0003F80A2A|nr:tyrosine-type recombinase/integrase [Selenomonas ruminantium]
MLSEKERLVVDIVNDMHGELSDEQMGLLKQVLYTRVMPLEIKLAEANIVPVEQTNVNLIKNFIVAKSVEGLAVRSLKFYKSVLLRMDKFIKKPVTQITTVDIQCFLAMLIQTSSKGNADNCRRVMSSFFGWMTDNEIIIKNPTRRCKKIKSDKKIKLPFSTGEIEQLRYKASDIRTRAMLEFLLSTGCRVTEMSQLNRSQIDFDKGEVIVFGKGSKERVCYLNEVARLYMKKYLETRDDDNPALFVDSQKPHNRLGISRIEVKIRELGREAGVMNVHPHRFRRTTASWASRKGMKVELIQKMLGHTSINTTMIYTAVAQEDVKAAHEKYCG